MKTHELNLLLSSDKLTGWQRWNGGVQCDLDDGPCSCGAWHKVTEDRVKQYPIWRDTSIKFRMMQINDCVIF